MKDIHAYWQEPPPEPSPALEKWVVRLRDGWRPNRRVRDMGYAERAEFFNVYLWEYFHVIYPLLKEKA